MPEFLVQKLPCETGRSAVPGHSTQFGHRQAQQ